MENAFIDAAVRPDQGAIRVALGEASGVWDQVLEVFAAAGAEVTWRHYRDGGWLAKASRSGKTLAWLAIGPGVLQVSFHFAERLRSSLLHDEAIAGPLRDRITRAPVSGRRFTVSLKVRTPDGVADVARLLASMRSAE